VSETLFLERMRRERFARDEHARQVAEMKDELWMWLMKPRPDVRTNEVLKALAWVTEMYVHVRVEGETRAIRRRLNKWGVAAWKFGRGGV